jgi:hypothetical protein
MLQQIRLLLLLLLLLLYNTNPSGEYLLSGQECKNKILMEGRKNEKPKHSNVKEATSIGVMLSYTLM